jgi:ERCC4-type nuclease
MVQIPITSRPARHFGERPIPTATQKTGDVDPLVLPFTIFYDHRERAGGWRFSGLIGGASDKYRPLVVQTKETFMPTADYTVEGVPIFIERKSPEDFISTITHGRENFKKEHDRMKMIEDGGGQCCVIIEAGYEQIMAELESGSSMRQVPAAVVRGSVAAQINDYGIPWVFAGSRRAAEEMAFWVLRKAWERAQERVK